MIHLRTALTWAAYALDSATFYAELSRSTKTTNRMVTDRVSALTPLRTQGGLRKWARLSTKAKAKFAFNSRFE